LIVSRRPLALTAALAVLALACDSDPGRAEPVPLDAFSAPIGFAMAGGDLLVVSSNADLAYGYEDGGSVVPVALSADGSSPAAIRAGAGVRIPSLGGQIAVADAAACGLAETFALVPSRSTETLYRITVGPDGSLACGPGCAIPVGGTYVDPYDVAVVCRPGEEVPAFARARAFVGMLRAPTLQGAIQILDLATGEVRTAEGFPGKPRGFAYDAARARLFVTHTDNIVDAPLGWIELSGGCDPSLAEGIVDAADAGRVGCPRHFVDLLGFARGVEPQGVALGQPLGGGRRRVYVAARLYDPDVAAAIGARPGVDVGGALLVLETEEGASGELDVTFVRAIPVGLGASEVEVLPPRAPVDGRPRRDLVAVTATDDGLLILYDDEAGAIAKVFGRVQESLPGGPPAGAPEVGGQPFGLLSRPLGATRALLYVASVGDDQVTAVEVDLEDPDASRRLGPVGGGAL
jgi:hypothetical protein